MSRSHRLTIWDPFTSVLTATCSTRFGEMESGGAVKITRLVRRSPFTLTFPMTRPVRTRQGADPGTWSGQAHRNQQNVTDMAFPLCGEMSTVGTDVCRGLTACHTDPPPMSGLILTWSWVRPCRLASLDTQIVHVPSIRLSNSRVRNEQFQLHSPLENLSLLTVFLRATQRPLASAGKQGFTQFDAGSLTCVGMKRRTHPLKLWVP